MKSQRTQQGDMRIAFHEAGHALIIYLEGYIDHIESMTIDSPESPGTIQRNLIPGYVLWVMPDVTKLKIPLSEEIINYLISASKVSLAGELAERVWWSRKTSKPFVPFGTPEMDISQLKDYLNALYPEDPKMQQVKEQEFEQAAFALLESHYKELSRIAHELIERRTLTKDEILKVIESWE